MNIRFRNLKKQDIENMIQMAVEVGYEIRYEILSDRVNSLIKNDSTTIIVAANEENKLIGWIQVEVGNFIFSAKTCNILALYVDKNYRGRKIGKMLLEKAQDWAIEKQCEVFKLCSDMTRIDSHDFYKHMGFKHIKTQQVFFRRIMPTDNENMMRE